MYDHASENIAATTEWARRAPRGRALHVLLAPQPVDGRAARVARGRADDGDALLLALEEVLEQVAERLQRHVLEGKRRPVEELHDLQVPHLLRRHRILPVREVLIAPLHQVAQISLRDLVACVPGVHESPKLFPMSASKAFNRSVEPGCDLVCELVEWQVSPLLIHILAIRNVMRDQQSSILCQTFENRLGRCTVRRIVWKKLNLSSTSHTSSKLMSNIAPRVLRNSILLRFSVCELKYVSLRWRCLIS